MGLLVTVDPETGDKLPEPQEVPLLFQNVPKDVPVGSLFVEAAREISKRLGGVAVCSAGSVENSDNERALVVALETQKERRAWIALSNPKGGFDAFQEEQKDLENFTSLFGVFDRGVAN